MNVIADALEVTATRALHDQRLVATGEQVPKEFVALAENTGLDAQKPFYPGAQVRLRRLDHPMKTGLPCSGRGGDLA